MNLRKDEWGLLEMRVSESSQKLYLQDDSTNEVWEQEVAGGRNSKCPKKERSSAPLKFWKNSWEAGSDVGGPSRSTSQGWAAEGPGNTGTWECGVYQEGWGGNTSLGLSCTGAVRPHAGWR